MTTQVIEYIPKSKNTFSKIEDKKYSLQFLPDLLISISNEAFLSFKDRKLKSAYLIDITHNLLLKYYFKKENLFNLSSLILKEKYGSNYNYYINYLISINIIVLVKNYKKGSNARIYKLNTQIITGNITRYKNRDKVLIKKYKNAVSSINEINIRSNSIDFDIKKKLIDDLFYTQIQLDKAIFFLDSSLQDIDIYNRNKYSVECIRDNHIFYHFDSYGRLHTNFTILKSFIRKNCLLIDGEETSEIDINSSQPLFLCKIIESTSISVDKNEFDLFKFLTFNGKFYQYIMDNSDIKEKNLVKKMIYKVLFGKNYNSKGDKIFKGLFPTIYEFIKLYKKESGNYKTLSHDLQRLESNLIFNKIIREILTIDPSIRLITVHDSIICQLKHRDIVNDIFKMKLFEEFFD